MWRAIEKKSPPMGEPPAPRAFLSCRARDAAGALALSEADMHTIAPTGPLGAPGGARWISCADVLKHAFRTRPSSHQYVQESRAPDGTRLALWSFRNDPVFGSAERAYAGCTQFALRPYQQRAVDACVSECGASSGLLHMCCGAGKTFVGSALMNRLRLPTVVITTHGVSVDQWMLHLRHMGIPDGDVVRMSGERARSPVPLPAVLIATYAMYARAFADTDSPWHTVCLATQVLDCLVVLDEVHSAPAETFRHVCSMRAKCIVGFTATLCREDDGVRHLLERVGPVLVCVDVNALETTGHVSRSRHVVVHVPLASDSELASTVSADSRSRRGLCRAILNPHKVRAMLALIRRHVGDHILVFCDDLVCIRALHSAARADGIRATGPVTGKTALAERLAYFGHFEAATSCCLFLSRIGDNAVDLARANVLIKMSTVSRSRTQEEQRNGRGARTASVDLASTTVYTLLSIGTREEDFFQRREEHLRARGFVVEHAWLRGSDTVALLPRAE
jgi:DNA excision repair protein ERCC-3